MHKSEFLSYSFYLCLLLFSLRCYSFFSPPLPQPLSSICSFSHTEGCITEPWGPCAGAKGLALSLIRSWERSIAQRAWAWNPLRRGCVSDSFIHILSEWQWEQHIQRQRPGKYTGQPRSGHCHRSAQGGKGVLPSGRQRALHNIKVGLSRFPSHWDYGDCCFVASFHMLSRTRADTQAGTACVQTAQFLETFPLEKVEKEATELCRSHKGFHLIYSNCSHWYLVLECGEQTPGTQDSKL